MESKIAFLFPGQGAQTVGMGKEMYEHYPAVRELYSHISEILGKDMAKLCFESTEEELARTENTQIAIAITSLGMFTVLQEKGIQPNVVAGLSLGEYVALMCAGILSQEDGMRLLQKRGYYMEQEAPKEKFAMAAIIGIPCQPVEEVCQKLQAQGKFVMPANYNYAGQTVISGNEEAVALAIEQLQPIARVVRLKTGGAFHTTKLEKARQKFTKVLEQTRFQTEKLENPSLQVIKNLDGTPYTSKDSIPAILSKHIVSPLRFDKTIDYMLANGITTFIEVGPGKTMIGFVKKELQKRGADLAQYTIQEGTTLL